MCKLPFKTLMLSAVFWALLASLPAAAESDSIGEKCSANDYRAFDFWLGEWDVYAQGKRAGQNKIERILQGCAIAESWSSISGGEGHSYNAFDAQSGHWNQFWVDSNGLVLRLVGEAKPGGMSLLGLLPIEGDKTIVMRHRITWTALAHGRVRQEWSSARSDSEDWQVVFDGLYVPAGEPAPDFDQE